MIKRRREASQIRLDVDVEGGERDFLLPPVDGIDLILVRLPRTVLRLRKTKNKTKKKVGVKKMVVHLIGAGLFVVGLSSWQPAMSEQPWTYR